MVVLEAFIKQKGLSLGFDKVAIARAQTYPEHEALKNWLEQGRQGTMDYMVRGQAKRLNPLEVMPQARSVITCALNYNAPYPYSVACRDSGRGWIARYAWGEDYHPIMEKLLRELSTEISHIVPGTIWKFYVDTGPVMERVFAKNAGIGWIGKNTCVIDPKLGSWLFLGVILTDLELKPDPIVEDHCGKCTACIEACPTQAITPPPVRRPSVAGKTAEGGRTGGGVTEPYTLDARRCISYLTIEHKGEIDPELQSKMGNHIFGCDICQNVCPWNQKSPRTSRSEFQPRAGFFNPDLFSFRNKVKEDYPTAFKNSPLKRAKQSGLLRNLVIAIKNNKT